MEIVPLFVESIEDFVPMIASTPLCRRFPRHFSEDASYKQTNVEAGPRHAASTRRSQWQSQWHTTAASLLIATLPTGCKTGRPPH